MIQKDRERKRRKRGWGREKEKEGGWAREKVKEWGWGREKEERSIRLVGEGFRTLC